MSSFRDDRPVEECGVVAVRVPDGAQDDVAGLCHLGLFALQHRGQESCGIAVAGGEEFRIEKDMGLVAETACASPGRASGSGTPATRPPARRCASTPSR